MSTTMAPPQPTEVMDKQPTGQKDPLQELRELYAEGSEVGQVALEKVMPQLELAIRSPGEISTAGRTGLRQGKVSELTVIAPFAPGGAKRLRALLKVLGANFGDAGEKVGTVHDMRFVFFDDDTRMLFATAYDGEWDPYIDDFATKIPVELDLVFSTTENFPGLRTPGIKDWIAKFQITAEAWYVANPDLTVAETRKLKRDGRALDEFLDQIAEPPTGRSQGVGL